MEIFKTLVTPTANGNINPALLGLFVTIIICVIFWSNRNKE